jgi:hypothetical protein
VGVDQDMGVAGPAELEHVGGKMPVYVPMLGVHFKQLKQVLRDLQEADDFPFQHIHHGTFPKIDYF